MILTENMNIYSAGNFIELREAKKLTKKFKEEGKDVGLCHGGFDLLHPGQIKHLESAKTLCDLLFVSVTSDRFVELRKGSGRPIFPDVLRAYMIANLKFVDYVFVSDFQRGIEVIKNIQPTFYIKGPDFINKMTPGITAERQAIASVGGEIKYTTDSKLSTTEIIDYIKERVDEKHLLLGIDRDGTLIKEENFLGREDNWKEKIILKENVIGLISFLQTKYNTTKIVVSNQAGVAKGYFDCQTVEKINSHLEKLLEGRGIKIDNWQYCPDVDLAYATSKKDEIEFDKDLIKLETRRKPNNKMLLEGVKTLGKNISDFDNIIIFGDREEDLGLAKTMCALYIDANFSYEDAKKRLTESL